MILPSKVNGTFLALLSLLNTIFFSNVSIVDTFTLFTLENHMSMQCRHISKLLTFYDLKTIFLLFVSIGVFSDKTLGSFVNSA